MGYKEITPGDKIAKAQGARFIKSKGGTPGIEVQFRFEEPATGNFENLNWVGWLSAKAKENTMDTLVNVLGCNGNDAVDLGGVFTDPNFIDKNKEVKLVVELEEGKDAEGNTKVTETGEIIMYPRIKWVNNVGGSGYAAVTPDVVKSELATIGFKASFMAANQGRPAAQTKAPAKPAIPEAEVPY